MIELAFPLLSSIQKRNAYRAAMSFKAISTLLAIGILASVGLHAKDPSPVFRMLVPGFTVQELPVRLSNQNSLRFAPDGSLTTLGYDGRIWCLRDTDGDGLEDQAIPFWDRDTLSVPVGMAWSTHGLYVSSHGKVSLLRDTDGDGRADTEEIVASGWPPTDVASGGVDATSVTLDRDGNVYFGLLVADYSNAYRFRRYRDLKPEEKAWLNSKGRAAEGPPDDEVSLYDIDSPRGTIQKFAPRTHQRTTVATGIRVPYQLAFNSSGDLFCTDQEGETWMPHGNPLDELNHILPGHHYGFPPPHERWLPNLISTAPVVGFGPQHESTCGFVFNEPIEKSPALDHLPEVPLPVSPGQGLFGPVWWKGDAVVTGESRGKLWRVHLMHTPEGYVGREYLFARIRMLVMDVAISPAGDLYVACHSGEPDWGTGPQGIGRIFKIRYTGKQEPQPVAVWAENQTQVRIAFDRPIEPSVTEAFRAGTQSIEFGEYVRAADRYEFMKPSYAVVAQQEATPRGHLAISSATWDGASSNLVLTTAPHSLNVHYSLTVPGVKSPGASGPGSTVELDYDLSGANRAPVSGPRHWTRADWASTPAWALPVAASSGTDSRPNPWTAGDWEEGRALFVEKLACAKCHRLRGEGALAGPDLSNLVHRDVASVLRDIRDPNATLHPDYVTFQAERKNGERLLGFLRNVSADEVGLVDVAGQETIMRRDDLAELKPTGQSLMPSGLLDGLKESEIRNLLTFLMKEPPIRPEGLLGEVLENARSARAASNSEPASADAKPLRLVLVASPRDHGPGQHDYPTWQTNWNRWLGASKAVKVETAWLWPSSEQLSRADVLVFYFWNHDWNATRLEELGKFQQRGGGMVLIHAAVIADNDPEALAGVIGLVAQPVRSGYRHTSFDLQLKPATPALTRDLPDSLSFLDEPYWPMIGDTNAVQIHASAEIDGELRPLMWSCARGKGRVFASIPGHYQWTLEDPAWRTIILRAIAWVGHRPEDWLLPAVDWKTRPE